MAKILLQFVEHSLSKIHSDSTLEVPKIHHNCMEFLLIVFKLTNHK